MVTTNPDENGHARDHNVPANATTGSGCAGGQASTYSRSNQARQYPGHASHPGQIPFGYHPPRGHYAFPSYGHTLPVPPVPPVPPPGRQGSSITFNGQEWQPGANFGGRFSFGEGARDMRIDGMRVDVAAGSGNTNTGAQSAVRTPSDDEDDRDATTQDEASTSDSKSPSTPSTLDSDNQGPQSRPGAYCYFWRDAQCRPDGGSAHRGPRYPNHSAPYTMPPPPGRRVEAFYGIEDMDMDGLNVNIRGGRTCDGVGAFNYAKGIKIKGGNVFLSLD
ncbi:hypothetical protein NLJ89_g10221 [Agrocybe chaxingu]|uniref:Uncharacterized protein n=1 Tax=Agrocybe chaxingu TaxID=84603 RepID=A0A9W8JZ43_9AGAR|nr:hypothetical protein NLJ89_g10221 [Agrocybe chaxingu]